MLLFQIEMKYSPLGNVRTPKRIIDVISNNYYYLNETAPPFGFWPIGRRSYFRLSFDCSLPITVNGHLTVNRIIRCNNV